MKKNEKKMSDFFLLGPAGPGDLTSDPLSAAGLAIVGVGAFVPALAPACYWWEAASPAKK